MLFWLWHDMAPVANVVLLVPALFVRIFFEAKRRTPTCSELFAARSSSTLLFQWQESCSSHTAGYGFDNFIRQWQTDMSQGLDLMIARFASAVNGQLLVEGDSKASNAWYRLNDNFWHKHRSYVVDFVAPLVALNCITSDLIGLSWRPFICSHEWTPAVQSCSRHTLSKTSAFDAAMQIFVSSAYWWWLKLNELMTAMYNEKRSGPRDDSWGTPVCTGDTSEELCFQRTNVDLTSKYERIQSRALSVNAKVFSSWLIRVSRSTQSNAANLWRATRMVDCDCQN